MEGRETEEDRKVEGSNDEGKRQGKRIYDFK